MRVSPYPPAAANRYLRCIARLIDAQAKGREAKTPIDRAWSAALVRYWLRESERP